MLIKNGRILSPGDHREWTGDIRLRDGQIAELGDLTPEPNEKVLEAAGLCAAPGLVDVHVHFRDPGLTYKEDLHTGSLAAAAGGFTAVVCMANTKPVLDTPELLKDFYERASREKIRIYSVAAVTKGLGGKELTDFPALLAAGACGFSDDGIPLMDEKLAASAMSLAKELDLPLSFHEEDPNFIEKSGTNRTAPAVAEDLLVARDCMLALHTGAKISIQHIS